MDRRCFVLAGAALIACAAARVATAAAPKRFRGKVIEVNDTTIKVQGADGQIRLFRLKGKFGMTVAHLKEHMREQEPIMVFYQEEGNDLVATRITD